MFGTHYSTKISFALGITALLCGLSSAQEQDVQRQRGAYNSSSSGALTERPADFARDNLNRVAASASQIRAVLNEDAGLMVEMKRWVAKEATGNGQIVEDSVLTDDAIFERLDRDITFRAVATRLAQRYGYLLPTMNPESDAAKQQEFVLKERARRLVQIEAQEDSESLRPEGRQEQAACDLAKDPECEPTSVGRPGRRRTAARQLETPDSNPRSPEDNGPPVTLPPMLHADANRRQAPGADGAASLQAAAAAEPDLLMGSNVRQRPSDSFDGTSSRSALSGLGALPSGPRAPEISELAPGNSENVATLSAGRRNLSAFNSGRAIPMERELAPVTMVHKPNPYYDIPSLYDMYVQASPKAKGLDRFGER